MSQIPLEYLGALGAAAAGYMVLRLFLSLSWSAVGPEGKPFRKLVADRYFNLFFVFVLGWKLSPLIFQTGTVLGTPSALLYLPGGFHGTLLGAGAALGYLIWVLVDPRKQVATPQMPLLRKSLLLGMVTGVVVGTGIYFLTPGIQAAPEKAPDFSLELKEGESIHLDTFRGKPVVLNVWASWCPPCRAEFPEMAAFQDQVGERAVLLAINAALTEKTPQDAESFLSGQRVNFPVAYDRDGRFQQTYQVAALPTTVIIDAEGRLVWRRSGAISSEMLLQVLSQLEK